LGHSMVKLQKINVIEADRETFCKTLRPVIGACNQLKIYVVKAVHSIHLQNETLRK
jgi:hypothetical protein